VLGRRRRLLVPAVLERSRRAGVSRGADVDSGRIGLDLGASTAHAPSVVRRRWEHVPASRGRIDIGRMSPELVSRTLNG
jgi:hypothetical protein